MDLSKDRHQQISMVLVWLIACICISQVLIVIALIKNNYLNYILLQAVCLEYEDHTIDEVISANLPSIVFCRIHRIEHVVKCITCRWYYALWWRWRCSRRHGHAISHRGLPRTLWRISIKHFLDWLLDYFMNSRREHRAVQLGKETKSNWIVRRRIAAAIMNGN